MKFKDWFDEKLITVYTEEELKELDFHSVRCNLKCLKKLYNAYKHTGLLYVDEVHIIRISNNPKDVYYFAADDKYINFDTVIDYLFNIIGYDLLSNIDKDTVKKYFLFSYEHMNKEFKNDEKYYFTLTLNPNRYNIHYIRDIEYIITEAMVQLDIDTYCTKEDMVDNFINLINTNEQIKNIIANVWRDFAILSFDSYSDLSSYNNMKLEDNIITRKLNISEDEMNKLLNFLKECDNSSDCDEYYIDDNDNKTLLN